MTTRMSDGDFSYDPRDYSPVDFDRYDGPDWAADDDADEALRAEVDAIDAAAFDARSAQEREHAALDEPGRYATADEFYGGLTADPAYLASIPWESPAATPEQAAFVARRLGKVA